MSWLRKRKRVNVDQRLRKKYVGAFCRCPSCNALVSHDASECWRCGQKLASSGENTEHR